MDWLAQCQDNVTVGYEVMLLAGFPVGQYYSHHECALSQIGTLPDMTLDVAKT